MNNSIYSDQGQYSSLLSKENLTENKEFDDSVTISILDAGYLSSIELKREKIRKELAPIFHFSHKTREIDFISANNDLCEILPSIGAFFNKEVADGLLMSLELLEEENDWKTLFINIPINEEANWSRINTIIDSFYDNMFDLFPSVMEKLNIDLVTTNDF